MEVVMKIVKSTTAFSRLGSTKSFSNRLSFKAEIRVYRDLKKGMKHSLLRENVCDMLDYGVYDNRRVIIMPRLGLDWYDDRQQNSLKGYSYDLFFSYARQAIKALRFIHKKGYVHQDVKPENFVFGSVEVNKSDESQVDKPLKSRLYLIDFGYAEKFKYANGTHKLREKGVDPVGTVEYTSRAGLSAWSQSRRDDMESLMFTLTVAKTNRNIFIGKTPEAMRKRRDDFINDPEKIPRIFRHPIDQQILVAFQKYAAELKKLFVSDEKEYFEMEPDYNAFCVCFGGTPGNNACTE